MMKEATARASMMNAGAQILGVDAETIRREAGRAA